MKLFLFYAYSLLIFCGKNIYGVHIRNAIPSNNPYDTIVESRYSEYEPNYILTNFKQSYYGQVKFKISFKFDLVPTFQKDKFYFAYTQYAFWDVYQPSAPMRELDFTPTVFYEHMFNNGFQSKDWNFKDFSLKIGYLHQSNGQDGVLNRSIFKITGNGDMAFKKNIPGQNSFGLDAVAISLRTWIWNMVADENKEIAKYQGYGQLITTFNFDYHSKAATTHYRSYPVQVNNAFIPAKAGISNAFNLLLNPFIGHTHTQWVPYLIFQYWHGFGESLVNYDNRYYNYKALNEYRLGIQFRVY